MPDAALKSGPHRKSLEASCVSGPADEERLTEGNPREQALQSNIELSGYVGAGKLLYNSSCSTILGLFLSCAYICEFSRIFCAANAL